MPKMIRWIVAHKLVQVLDNDLIKSIMDAGGQIGGGWSQVHQHINVNVDNKEKIEQMLISKGYTVCCATEAEICHPECYKHVHQIQE